MIPLGTLRDEALSSTLRNLSEPAFGDLSKGGFIRWMILHCDRYSTMMGPDFGESVPCTFYFGDIEVSAHEMRINNEEMLHGDLLRRLQYLLRTKFIEEGRVITW